MTESLPPMIEVQASSRSLGLATGAAELHGSLSGWLAGGGADGPDWLARILVDDAAPAPDAVLEQLRSATVAQIEDPAFGFTLMLPDADAPLYERSSALFEWCRGFLGGFGLAAGQTPTMSDEAREVLEDLARLAAAAPQEEGDEEDERALQEIEEFVRVAALLLHGDCALGPRHRKSFN